MVFKKTKQLILYQHVLEKGTQDLPSSELTSQGRGAGSIGVGDSWRVGKDDETDLKSECHSYML